MTLGCGKVGQGIAQFRTAQLVNALGIKPDEAESRMKSRIVPEILSKMEEDE